MRGQVFSRKNSDPPHPNQAYNAPQMAPSWQHSATKFKGCPHFQGSSHTIHSNFISTILPWNLKIHREIQKRRIAVGVCDIPLCDRTEERRETEDGYLRKSWDQIKKM